jgi:hypothetical protein
MGPNTTGVANTNDYNLGRGKLYAAEIDTTTGMPKAYRFLGNAPEFSVSLEAETLEHQSSTGGLKVTDKEVTISQTMNVSLTLDEINFENLALFFSGAKATHTNPHTAGAVNMRIPTANVELGRWYDIVNGTGTDNVPAADDDRVYDLDPSTVSVTDTLDNAYTAGTDYILDTEFGRIFFPSTGSIDTGDNVDITIAQDAAQQATINEVRGLTQTSVAVALKFISENPANNDRKTEFQFHQINLKAEGDFGLISDEYTQMTFTGVAESNSLADANSSTVTVRSVPTS